jgi:3-methyladenine DNA glycosylase AlkD
MPGSCDCIVAELNAMADPVNCAGMARFGINPTRALGISMPRLQLVAKRIGHDHELALALWKTGIHEARILAALIDCPGLIDVEQMNAWAADFDSWDVCDQVCMRLFRKSTLAWDRVWVWAGADAEFVRRAGFALMATLAVHDKKTDDAVFEQCLAVIAERADDERNFVKKSVNWALRQIGKRNDFLRNRAMEAAGTILKEKADSPAARWVARDALRELESVDRRRASSRAGSRQKK